MGKNSKIEWTATHNKDGTITPGHTFNPWIGCSKVDSGCQNCYAERDMDHRFGIVEWGPNGTRVRTSERYWQQPYKWNTEAKMSGKRVKVFCGSLCDIFEDRNNLNLLRYELRKVIVTTPHLTWMLLTKRPQNVKLMIPDRWFDIWPSHVWMGTSVSNQEEADRRIPELLRIPAPVRFVSVEPLLGSINFGDTLTNCEGCGNQGSTALFGGSPPGEGLALCRDACKGEEGPSLHWIIAGGESGPNARPMHPQWAQDIRDQCVEAEVSFHFKQWGEWWPIDQGCGSFINDLSTSPPLGVLHLDGRLADDFDPLIDDGKVGIVRVGKKAAGRLLDGRKWNEEPTG